MRKTSDIKKTVIKNTRKIKQNLLSSKQMRSDLSVPNLDIYHQMGMLNRVPAKKKAD